MLPTPWKVPERLTSSELSEDGALFVLSV